MRNEIDNGADRRPRRFSEGQEHIPSLPSSARVGRFSDGMARSLAGAGGGAWIGTFAGGQALRPDAPAARRVGSFGDTFAPSAPATAGRSRLGVPRTRPAPQTA